LRPRHEIDFNEAHRHRPGGVQAALKLVLEPIFEADFLPCSYGFCPNRRAHDVIAVIHALSSRPRDDE
jgi:hypothetical protein